MLWCELNRYKCECDDYIEIYSVEIVFFVAYECSWDGPRVDRDDISVWIYFLSFIIGSCKRLLEGYLVI